MYIHILALQHSNLSRWPLGSDFSLTDILDVRMAFDRGASRVLGLLRELIKKFLMDSSNGESRHWSEILMEPDVFSYSSCSIETFKCSMAELFGENWREKLKEFVLILDEFPSYLFSEDGSVMAYEAALGRNLARAVSLPCLVMGTNTRVSNLVELISAGSSGVSGVFKLWCTLFTRLPSTNWEYLFQTYEIPAIFHKIKEAFGVNLGDRLVRFLEDQIKSSRPGISKMICDALCQYQKLGIPETGAAQISLVQFMNKLASTVQFLILERKHTLNSEQSIPGHFELMMSNTIELYGGKSVDKSAMINHHMFYLINTTGSPSLRLYVNRVAESNGSAFYLDEFKTHFWIPTASITSPIKEVFTY